MNTTTNTVVDAINEVLPTMSYWLNVGMATIAIGGFLYGVGWILYQLDYFDRWLDNDDLTSPIRTPAESALERENTAGGTQ